MNLHPAYPTDLAYPDHFHCETAPSWMLGTLVALGQQVSAEDRPCRYLDLGCGTGLGVALLAAANPNGRFVGVDFNPDHIEKGRKFAKTLPNLQLVEAGFDTLDEGGALAEMEFDFVVLHGVYSWIAPEQRAAVRRIMAKALAPGGIVYLHYTTHPGHSAFAGAQALLRRIAATTPGGSQAGLEAGLGVAKALDERGAGYFVEHKAIGRMLFGETEAAAYLAHDLLPTHWSALHVGDVIDEMADIGCSYVGSATVIENIDALSLPAATQPVIAAIGDLAARETARDLARNQSLRRDIYRKGWAGVAPDTYRAQIERLRFAALPGLGAGSDLVLETRIGPVSVDAGLVDPVRRRLRFGPASLAEIGQASGIGNPALLIRGLQAMIAAREVHPVALTQPPDFTSAHRLNALLAAPAPEFGWLAAPAIGSAIAADALGLAVACALLDEPALCGNALACAVSSRRPATKPGSVAAFEAEILPVWRQLGVVPG